MNWALALQGILPLLVFAIVDIFASLRTALIAAIVVSFLEAAFSYYTFGEVDQLTWISLGLVVSMGVISIYMKSDRLFKFQPVVLGLVSAGTLAYFQLVGNPLMVQMIPKVAPLMPEAQRATLSNPAVIAVMARLDFLLIFTCLIHAALVAWAALNKSTMAWLVIRGAGLYGLLLVTLILNALLGPAN